MRKLLVIILIIIAGCSLNRTREKRLISSLEINANVPTDYIPDRVCIDNLYDTMYLLDRNQNRIDIFQGGKFVNLIGGSGSIKSKFKRLSDITIATDGGIFTLDSASNTIRKYDRNGQQITEWKLEGFKRAERFVADKENNFYIFDFFGRTVSYFNTLNGSVDFDFGRFTFTNVSSIDLVGDKLIIREKQADKTFIYSTIGKQINELSGDFTVDLYGNYIKLNTNWLELEHSRERYCLSVEKYLSIRSSNNSIYCTKQNGFVTVKPIKVNYEQ